MRFPSKTKKILIVASHPDDEVLGCGATIARLSKEGHHLHILILGEGISSRYLRRAQASRKGLAQLQADSKAVAKLLGADSVSFEKLPDNRFDELPILEIVKRVERCVEAMAPEVIFTHHPGDLNVDHRMTFQAVLTATRPMKGCPVKEIYTFEIPSSTEWAFQQIEPAFRPNVFVDISGSLDTKVQALCHYESEVRAFPHPRSPEAIRAIARRWGSMVGSDAVEAFELIRSIR